MALATSVFLDPTGVPTVPFERPSFAPDASSTLSVRSGGGMAGAAVTLKPTSPVGLPYAVSSAAFHPVVARCGVSGRQVQDPTQLCTPGQPYQDMLAPTCAPGGGHPWVATQVYASPLDTGSRYLALVQVNACQFCPALTGTADCTAAPLQPPNGPLPMTAGFIGVVTNIAIDPLTGGPAGVALPTGHYAITLVEPTGLLWSIPNELAYAGGLSGAAQSAAFTVTP